MLIRDVHKGEECWSDFLCPPLPKMTQPLVIMDSPAEREHASRAHHWDRYRSGRGSREDDRSPIESGRQDRSSRHDRDESRRHRHRRRHEDDHRYRRELDARERSPSRRDSPSQHHNSMLTTEASPSAPAPNFERSGLLAKESNNVNGVALKYHEPPEAKKPRNPWRMFVFKDGKEMGMSLTLTPDMFVLGRQSCYLFGRDRAVVDIPTEHPSCSKQHAVIQFRQVTKRNDFGDVQRSVKYVLRAHKDHF